MRSFHVGLIGTRLFFLKRQLFLQFFDLGHSGIASLIKLRFRNVETLLARLSTPKRFCPVMENSEPSRLV